MYSNYKLNSLPESLKVWSSEGVRGVWMKIYLKDAALVDEAAKVCKTCKECSPYSVVSLSVIVAIDTKIFIRIYTHKSTIKCYLSSSWFGSILEPCCSVGPWVWVLMRMVWVTCYNAVLYCTSLNYIPP